jgi:hypothetical protein
MEGSAVAAAAAPVPSVDELQLAKDKIASGRNLLAKGDIEAASAVFSEALQTL